MMTFIEYLQEAAMMSSDSMKQKASVFDKLGLGKHDGSKPSKKRANQIHKRSNRKAGYSEEEEPSMPAIRDRVQGTTNDLKATGGQRAAPEREFQKMKRRVRRTRGIGASAKGAMQHDEL